MICLFLLFLAFVCYLWLLIAVYVKMATHSFVVRRVAQKCDSGAVLSLDAGFL
jgi:hypothetical protein